MAKTPSSVEIVKPLSTWQKIKSGVTGFVKSAVHYLPRGIMFSAVLMGGSALLGNVHVGSHTLDFFGAQDLFNAGTGAVIERMGKTLLLGGLISGGVGAYQSVHGESQRRNAEIDAQAEELERCRACGPERQISMDPVVSGLPYMATKPPLAKPIFSAYK